MKITKMETFHVAPRWLFLKITTDEGYCGWGEPVLEGHSHTVKAAIEELKHILIGANPLQIEHLWQMMYRGSFYRGGPILMSAISGIEQALWDIKGKYYQMPIFEMLGGMCRDRIRMYGHLKPTAIAGDFPIEKMIDLARNRQEAGFTIMKYSVIPPILPIDTWRQIDAIVERFSSIREAVGKSIDVAVDFHGRVSPAMAKILFKELEPYHPFFVEEPCLPENQGVIIDLAKSTSIPIATGERLFTRWGFRELIESRAIAVFQPDVSHVGGIFESRKIAAMAEMNYASIAPHNPLGPISLAACLQLDACCPNCLVQEHPGMPDGRDLGIGILKTPFTIESGCLHIPNGPGLGIEVDEVALKDHLFDGNWRTPILTLQDGSMADW